MPVDNAPHTNENRYNDTKRWDPTAELSLWARPEFRKRLAFQRREWQESCTPSGFEPRTANEVIRDYRVRNSEQRPLFGEFWREGELAVLAGEPGAGKTLLAVQIAESIARGRHALIGNEQETTDNSGNYPRSTVRSELKRPVLFLDLHHSDLQFAQRYTAASPGTKRRRRYRFANNLRRASFSMEDVPYIYRGNFAKYIRHSFAATVEEVKPRVVVIDSLSMLDPAGRTDAAIRWMRCLRAYAHEDNIPILVTFCMNPRAATSRRPLELPRAATRILEAADSVFAIAPSTYGPEFRYVKHLASLRPVTHDAQNVLTYKIGRIETESQLVQNVHSNSPVSPSPSLPVSPSPNLAVSHSPHLPLSGSPHIYITTSQETTLPFLGFTHIGNSPESYHLEDHTEETLHLQRKAQIRALAAQGLPASIIEAMVGPDETARKKAKTLVDAIMDGSYMKYLKGE